MSNRHFVDISKFSKCQHFEDKVHRGDSPHAQTLGTGPSLFCYGPEPRVCARGELPRCTHLFQRKPTLYQGGVKSTPSSPRLRVRVILTDPEPVKEAL